MTGLEGGPFGVHTFFDELEQTLIVYGTRDEVPSNREAALELQKAIVERGSNITVPVKSDREVTDDDLKNHHLLLVGRPETNGAADPPPRGAAGDVRRAVVRRARRNLRPHE